MGDVDTATVVFSADDAYARPLTVAARSVVDTLAPNRRLQLCVLDMGISPAHRDTMRASLEDPRVELVWVDSLRDKVDHLPNTWTAITRATYARLYIPDVLPDVSRALYLDCDVLARRCVGDLFSSDLHGVSALATYDVQSVFVSFPAAVPLWFDAGRAPDELNFNAGVMLMDLERWRERRLTDECLRYLTDGRHHFAQDQEAINVVLAGDIGVMDQRWNQQAELFHPEYAVLQPCSGADVERIRADPWIVHFSNHPKPWVHGYEHPFAAEWFATLDGTAYAGWRPKAPNPAQRFVTAGARGARRAARRAGLLTS